ncbi:MAG: TIGR00645 family protein [Cytophagales bacterium]|nr:TIGR00645 family protein [Cytophagales bacterium]
MAMIKSGRGVKVLEDAVEAVIFTSRWVQAPVYLGLIFVSILYSFKFLQQIRYMAEHIYDLSAVHMMIQVLSLIDISMAINLLTMVIIGGYSIFTSRIDVDEHPDKPLWLEDMDAGILKIKLATSLATISGVHLLRTFINMREERQLDTENAIILEISIHLVFILSALLLAWVEKILHSFEPRTLLNRKERLARIAKDELLGH